jgi:F-box interacting protein
MLSTLTDFYSLSGDDFENIVKLNLPNPFQEENRYHVLDSGSITGILCHYQLDDGRTLFWQPITEEFKIIPQSHLHLDSPYLRIWVDPVGYGYDKVRDDYKLLRYVHYSELDRGECQQIGIPYIRDVSYDNLWEIYSLRSNSWKKLNDSDNLHWFLQSFNGKRVYMNEMCHWWHLSQPSDDGGVDLVSFDFVNEVFFTTPTPFNIFSTRIYITGLNGSIAFISWIWDTTIFDISILGEIGAKESWVKVNSIVLDHFLAILTKQLEQDIMAIYFSGKKTETLFGIIYVPK